MERRLIKRVDEYVVSFKHDIKNWFDKNGVVCKDEHDDDKTSEFMKFIYDSPGIQFNKEDFQKRKRVKNIVPYYERCIAKRANSEQCTRRKKDGCQYCGTHLKGSPHGIISMDEESGQQVKKIEVWVEEIKGIHYYIDENKNVYNHEDVMLNKTSPSIIAKWEKTEEGEYYIPEYS